MKLPAKNIFKKNLLILFILITLFTLTEVLSIKSDPNRSFFVEYQKKVKFKKALDKTRKYYKNINHSLETDEYVLLNYLWSDIVKEKNKKFSKDPFLRTINKDFKASIRKKSDLDKYSHLMSDWADKDILKTLYCDKINYTKQDFRKLKQIRDYRGNYGDTHYLLGLLFLDSLNCLDYETVKNEKENVINVIAKAQEKPIQKSIDLYAERIVFLYWAKEKDKVKYTWINKLVKAQSDDGYWRRIGEKETDPHITGLASLAIKYFINNDVEDIWFAN